MTDTYKQKIMKEIVLEIQNEAIAFPKTYQTFEHFLSDVQKLIEEEL